MKDWNQLTPQEQEFYISETEKIVIDFFVKGQFIEMTRWQVDMYVKVFITKSEIGLSEMAQDLYKGVQNGYSVELQKKLIKATL